jgi:hypothetical protein
MHLVLGASQEPSSSRHTKSVDPDLTIYIRIAAPSSEIPVYFLIVKRQALTPAAQNPETKKARNKLIF